MSEMDYEVLFAEAAQGLGQPRREAAVRAARIGSKRSFRIAARARRPLALAHAAAPRPLARRRVRLCTRGTRRCAQADRNGAILPVPCPTSHTPLGGVRTNGHVIARIGIHVSGKAHARASRVHKRTRAARYGRARVRLCTRHKKACAQADRNGAILPVSCPTLHTRGRPVCTSGHVLPPFAARVSACARATTCCVHRSRVQAALPELPFAQHDRVAVHPHLGGHRVDAPPLGPPEEDPRPLDIPALTDLLLASASCPARRSPDALPWPSRPPPQPFCRR